jgi:hypothetical protein
MLSEVYIENIVDEASVWYAVVADICNEGANLMHVHKVLSEFSLCGLHRLIWDST